MRALFIFCSILISYSSSEPTRINYAGYKAYLVQGDSHNLVQLKHSFQEPLEAIYLSGTNRQMELLVASHYNEVFQTKVTEGGLDATLHHPDISRVIAREQVKWKGSGFSWNAYYDVDEINTYLRNMGEMYSNVCSVITGGSSYEGRPLLGVRIVTQGDGVNSTKPKVFLESGIHAREWIAPAVTTYLINELLTSNDSDITSLRDSFEWHIFPTVNPDGYHYSHTNDRYWRKSRSRFNDSCYGVDLNRNWNYSWSGSKSTDEVCDHAVYCGPAPFSEIETRSLSQYISSLDNLLAYISVHCCARMLLIPYSDSTEHHATYGDLVRIGEASLDYGKRVNGTKYEGPATSAEILYAATGISFDWVKNVLNVPLVYGYELRGYYFYWPPSRIPEQGREMVQMLIGLFKKAKELGYYS